VIVGKSDPTAWSWIRYELVVLFLRWLETVVPTNNKRKVDVANGYCIAVVKGTDFLCCCFSK
jgi:hypothetical protein